MIENAPNLAQIISPLDWLVFGATLLLTVALVIYATCIKKEKTNAPALLEHLVMGRRLSLPFFVATLVATWYGGIFGVTQIAFEKGIYNFVTQGLFWYISYIIFALLLVKKITSYQALTLPELIGKMFGPRSAKLAGVLNFFNVLPIAYLISFALFLSSVTQISYELCLILSLLIVLSYSSWSGLKSVVLSDTIQFFTMCLGVLFVLIQSIYLFGGLDYLQANLPKSHFHPLSDVGLSTTLVWGFIALSTLVDPNFYQRCFAAKSAQTAKKGILISTLIWIGFDICTTFGALYAKSVIPEADSAKAYLFYAVQILPDGLRGFFLGAIAATILSTLDSYLFLAGSTLTYDLFPKKKNSRLFHQLGIVFVGVIALGASYIFAGNIKLVWKSLGSLSAGCMLFPVMLGYLFSRKLSDYCFVAASLSAATAMIAQQLTAVFGNIEPLYVGIITSSIAFIATHLIFSKKNS